MPILPKDYIAKEHPIKAVHSYICDQDMFWKTDDDWYGTWKGGYVAYCRTCLQDGTIRHLFKGNDDTMMFFDGDFDLCKVDEPVSKAQLESLGFKYF